MNRLPYLLLTVLLTQSGCTGLFEKPKPVSRAPVSRETEPSVTPPNEPIAPPVPEAAHAKPPAPRGETQTAAPPPAVAALLRDAEADRVAGNLDKAAATLERAERIQPRNPVVWQQLAQIRLQQHQASAAEQMAKKSNVLGAGNRTLIQRNWSIIAEARRQRGDTQGAADAEAKAGN